MSGIRVYNISLNLCILYTLGALWFTYERYDAIRVYTAIMS